MNKTNYWIYILLCSNGSYYTGYTTDLVRRYQEHCEGSAKCKYTRSFPPINIAQSWCVDDKSEALKIECYIKKLTKQKKQQFILDPYQLEQFFQCEVDKVIIKPAFTSKLV